MDQPFAPVENVHASSKIIFDAPRDEKHTYHIKTINNSNRRVGWSVRSNNLQNLKVDPPNGVLDPKEAIVIAISRLADVEHQEEATNDRITVEWTNAPDGGSKTFSRSWFQGDQMVHRKNIPIEYNY